QMLALKHLFAAKKEGRNLRVLYIVHNAAMAQSVIDRFRVLGAEEFLTGGNQILVVSTLSEYGRTLIGLSDISVIDKDAQNTKLFQFEQVQEALRLSLSANSALLNESTLLTQVRDDQELFDLFAILLMAE